MFCCTRFALVDTFLHCEKNHDVRNEICRVLLLLFIDIPLVLENGPIMAE